MMEALKNIAGLGWVGALVVMFYVWNLPPETYVVSNTPIHSYTEDMVVTPFTKKVAGWSWELRDMANPYKSGGNCLAVAQEIQSRLVKEGRMAVILITDPDPNDGESHAIVLFNSKVNGRLDSVIDNGFVTKNFPRKRSGLYTGVFGKYMGQIDYCDTTHKNKCYLKKNSVI